jgi:WD40 repeat protein
VKNSQRQTPPQIPDYELLRQIGRGSYGDVWLARSVTGVFRVIKIVHRDRFEDERPFRRELEGISRFQAAVSGRPRQLALLHVGRNEEAGYFYYVMEPADDADAGSAIDPDRYVPLTLRELFSRRGRLPAAECVQLALELARGLAVLHEANLIHRDIKPSNIIFVQRVPKLADVGLVAASEATMTCIGTPGYVPPEGPGSAKGDIYSLGKVLYELATGMDRMEFPRLPPDIRDCSDIGLLAEINSIVVRACHMDPAQRQASAEALARELEFVQAGKSVVLLEGMRRQMRVLAIGTAAVVTVAAVIVGLLVWRSAILGDANRQTRRALYRSDLAVAQLAKASGDLGRARAALERQIPAPGEPDLRGLEWSILAREVRGEGRPLEPVASGVAIRKIAVDPTGRWVAASLSDDRVGVWDLTDGRVVRVIENARVLGGFTTDGAIVIDEPVRALRYESPTNGTLRRIETGQRLGSLLPDGRTLVVSPKGDFILSLLEPVASRTPASFNATTQWPEFGVSMFDLSSDGKWLVVSLLRGDGAHRHRKLATVDLTAGTEEWSLSLPGRVVWIRFSPDNLHFVANIGGLSPTICRVNDQQYQLGLEGHSARVQDASFSSDGSLIATAGADQTVRVWNTASGQQVSIHRGLGRPATAAAWTPSTEFIVAGDANGSIRVFDFPPRLPQKVVPGLFGDVHGDLVFDPSGEILAVTATTNSLALISTKDLTEVGVITNVFQPIAFSPDGAKLWVFGSDWSLQIADPAKKIATPIRTILPEAFWLNCWAVSPDQTRIAVAGNTGQIAFVELANPQPRYRIDPTTNTIWAMAFSADSQELWTGTVGGIIRRWSAADATLIEESMRVEGDLQAIALSGDQRWLAVALFDDSSIRVFDRTRSRWLPPLVTHRRFVQSLVFTADGSRLISGGADGRVVLWRVPEFQEIAAFEVEPAVRPTGDEGIAVLKLSKNNSAVAALTEDGRLQLWRTQ